jgi:hypothetical protein
VLVSFLLWLDCAGDSATQPAATAASKPTGQPESATFGAALSAKRRIPAVASSTITSYSPPSSLAHAAFLQLVRPVQPDWTAERLV